MHIMEGFLPWQWCLVWWIIALPCVMLGIYQLKKVMASDRDALPLLGVTGGFIFILSSLKLPSVTGSCSHPTGTGLSTISFGPWITALVCAIVLLFQSLFLAHGGLSVLGANIVSMGIVGPLVGYGVYRLLRDTSINIYITVFLVCALADLFTYVMTSIELALAYPAETGGIVSSFILFMGIFAITQIPLAIVEGVVLALVFKYIVALKPDILIRLGIFSKEKIDAARSESLMVYKYTLEILTVIAIGAFCALFLYTSATMNGAEFAGSDNVGSGLVAELSGIPLENFQPLIPQWEPPSGEIESALFALQAAFGGILVGGVFGYWMGQKKA